MSIIWGLKSLNNDFKLYILLNVMTFSTCHDKLKLYSVIVCIGLLHVEKVLFISNMKTF